jgi:membrane protease YdiL (CAAX protease family)
LLRLLAGVAGLIATVAIFRLLLHPVLVRVPLLSPSGSAMFRQAVLFILLTAFYATFVHVYEKRAVEEMYFRWKWTLLGAIAGALSIGLSIALLYASGHYQLLSFRGFHGTVDVLTQIALAALLEELMFRALIFRVLQETFGWRTALVVSSLVFSVSHIGNGGFGVIGPLSVTLGGIMWALVFAISRNVWVTTAHHACWNATIFFTGLPLSGEEAWRAQAPFVSEYHGSILWTGGAFGPENSVVNLAVCLSVCVALWRIAAQRHKSHRGGSSRHGPTRPAPLKVDAATAAFDVEDLAT